eukprot:7847614-Ditylum_brightwellii.AAC.1
MSNSLPFSDRSWDYDVLLQSEKQLMAHANCLAISCSFQRGNALQDNGSHVFTPRKPSHSVLLSSGKMTIAT